ncbi:MAG: 1-(5-phosphoribosyl)-5-[(5-phosphoribosylamino)methylideneamino]imidazole-4-carboxamide isomerase [Planctomycetota bacterium]|jgi:phosphoribosylformimino-5-aminoimidazole carboxamide ribotide isomerase|nr:1-(5-phosphoribosyl)-5-[(5-phosphoribosylamino)methylideneamino]imidazole-4-carboxamide isomerase [Planctomycetota bacterium]
MPAIDIKDGKTVRLLRGERDQVTIYPGSPADMARHWEDQGATYLHVVDLDGAFDGVSANEPHIRDIVKAVSIPVEVGGGVRDLAKARRLADLGAARIILGTRALESRSFVDEMLRDLPGKINLGVDARGGRVAIKGWTETSGVAAADFLASFSGSGVQAIIYTDISRDGALAGANVQAMREACLATDIPIIASGGVSSPEDIRSLRELPLFGIIIGKALYEGKLSLKEAMAALDPP